MDFKSVIENRIIKILLPSNKEIHIKIPTPPWENKTKQGIGLLNLIKFINNKKQYPTSLIYLTKNKQNI